MVLALYAVIGIATAAVLAVSTGNHLLVEALIFMMGTAVRSIGTGFCHSIGPIAGLLMADHVDPTRFFVIPVVPLTVALLGTMTITWLWIGKVLRPEKMEKHLV